MVDHLTSSRLSGVGEYYFSQKLKEIANMNANGHQVINLGIGSPDLAPPTEVQKQLTEALTEPDFHRYQSYIGIPDLREAFASWYKEHYDVTLDAGTEVLPLMGSKEGIMHISMALLNEGDEVLIPNPGYPTYQAVTKLAGGRPRPYSLTPENGYYPDLQSLEAEGVSKVKLMWINYPHMPTGTPASQDRFNELRAFARKHQIVLVNDNPYSFTLTDRPESLLNNRQSDDLILELNSLSKSHNMAGWRVGMLGGHAALIQKVLTFKSNMDSGMFKPVMRAAIEALNMGQEWYDQLNEHYRRRRSMMHDLIDLLDIAAGNGQVGMFVWCSIPEDFRNGEAFSDHVLTNYKLFIPPGHIFGSEGDQFVRFSLCSKEEVLEEAIQRITK